MALSGLQLALVHMNNHLSFLWQAILSANSALRSEVVSKPLEKVQMLPNGFSRNLTTRPFSTDAPSAKITKMVLKALITSFQSWDVSSKATLRQLFASLIRVKQRLNSISNQRITSLT